MTKITIRLIVPILRIHILLPPLSTNVMQNCREHCISRFTSSFHHCSFPSAILDTLSHLLENKIKYYFYHRAPKMRRKKTQMKQWRRTILVLKVCIVIGFVAIVENVIFSLQMLFKI